MEETMTQTQKKTTKPDEDNEDIASFASQHTCSAALKLLIVPRSPLLEPLAL